MALPPGRTGCNVLPRLELVAQATLLPQPPEFQDYRFAPFCSVSAIILISALQDPEQRMQTTQD